MMLDGGVRSSGLQCLVKFLVCIPLSNLLAFDTRLWYYWAYATNISTSLCVFNAFQWSAGLITCKIQGYEWKKSGNPSSMANY